MVRVKLIIQKKENKPKQKNTRYMENKKFSLLVKVLELFLWCPNLVLASKPLCGLTR
jgi:hypothetical protein